MRGRVENDRAKKIYMFGVVLAVSKCFNDYACEKAENKVEYGTSGDTGLDR